MPDGTPVQRSPVRSCHSVLLLKWTAFSRLAERFNLSDYAYAHRGLWTADGLTENSLEALLAAADNGLGIEFDVRPAADGVPIIFHDPVLERMTAETGAVADRTSKDLLGLPLNGGGEIVSLATLLEAWPGETPLLCELKIDGPTDPETFAQQVGAMLLSHEGPAAAMSFSPQAVAALPSDLTRGQLILPSEMTGQTDLTSIATAAVDYFACHTSDASNESLQTARGQTPLITWTVKSAEACAALAPLTDSQIFEGFDSALAKHHILNT